jgi:hypothetical protein
MATTPWLFQNCPDSVEFRDLVPPHPSIVEKRIIRSFTCHRYITNATTMPGTAAGNLATNTPAADIGGSVTIQGAAISSLKWICVANETSMQGPPGTQALKQTQRWVTYTEWEEFDLAEA